MRTHVLDPPTYEKERDRLNGACSIENKGPAHLSTRHHLIPHDAYVIGFSNEGLHLKGLSFIHVLYVYAFHQDEDIFITEASQIAKIHMYLWLRLDRTDISEYERMKRQGKTNMCFYFYMNEFHTPSCLISGTVRVRSKLLLQHFFLPTSIRNERIIGK